jgi:hypothetical protein
VSNKSWRLNVYPGSKREQVALREPIPELVAEADSEPFYLASDQGDLESDRYDEDLARCLAGMRPTVTELRLLAHEITRDLARNGHHLRAV